jgi:ADP-ribosylglycohydrolase
MDENLRDRAQGCLLGQLIGDALGSIVEFRSGASIAAEYPQGVRELIPSPVFNTLAGQPTDDSEMALSLARVLAARGWDEEAVAAAYGDWLASGPFDSGMATNQALGRVHHAAPGSKATTARQAANPTTEANGALMRQSPLAIWGHRLAPDALAAVLRADTTLTHPSPVCQEASAAYGVALAATIREGLDGPAAHARALAWQRAHGHSPKITAALEAAAGARPAYQPQEGHVPIALQNAFYQALHAPSFEEGLVATVGGGGDTDTNGAIAGALLGAIHGAAAIPARWRAVLAACRPAPGAPGVYRPRPDRFWPVDALDLADALLTHAPDEL